MPSIRKKTSNRVKTRDREKRKKKVRDSRKKKTKATKKNPQWKSKKPKDPGIPNDFPYKDQILAEVQEQRRIAAEEKMRLKEQKQKARAIARGELVEENDVEGSQNDDGSDTLKDIRVDAEEIASLSAKAIGVELKRREQASLAVVEMEEEEAPVLFNHELPNLLTVLDKADVILEVLDARDPLAFRSKHIEDIAVDKGKKILFVLNKIDRCPREAVAAWLERLRTEQPTLLFRSASAFLPEKQPSPNISSTKKGKSKVPVNDALGGEPIISCLCEWAKTKEDSKLTVAVVGLANVGKSSLINSLLQKPSLPVYTVASLSIGPTTTESAQEVCLNKNGSTITLVDCPGLSFAAEDDVDESVRNGNRAKDILLRSKGRIDRLKDPTLPIPHIVSRASNEDLMLLYTLPAFPQGDFTAFLSAVARANNLVKKKGNLDLIGAARIVLRDWNSGKFTRYTTPPTSLPTAPPTQSSSNVDPVSTSFFTPLYAKDEAILAVLATRKEIRKKEGLVKLSSSKVEERQATLEDVWVPLEDDEDENDEDGGEREVDDSANMVLDNEEDEEEEESEGEGQEQGQEDEESSSESEDEAEEEATAAVVSPSHKQKRKRGLAGLASAPPMKRVSLDLVSSSSKGKKNQSRSHQRNPSEAKVKTKLGSAAVPKAVTAPKSILKRAGAAKGGLKEKVRSRMVGKAGLREEGEGEAYDFGRFF